MTMLQEAYYGGVLVGIVASGVVAKSILLIKEIIAEYKTTKNA